MKLLFYAFILILVVALIAGAILILTFDINRYRDDIANGISQKLGCPVGIQSLSVGFRNGLAIQANDVTLSYELSSPPAGFQLQTKNIFLKLQLEPLLRRKLEVSEIIIEQPVGIYESKTEQVKLLPIKPTAPAPVSAEKESFDRAVQNQKEAATKSVTKFSEFEIKAVHLERGHFTYRDLNRRVPFEFSVSDILVDISHLSLNQTIEFNGSLAVDIAGKKPLIFEGSFSYPEQTLKINATFHNAAKMIVKVTDIIKSPEIRADIGIDKLDFSSFYTEEQKRGEYLAGLLSGNVSMSSHGANGILALRSLSGIGKVRFEQGALKNRNVLRESIEKISQIPGLNVLFQSDLGERFNRLLASRDTEFDQVASNFQVGNMRLVIEFLSMIHPDYRINSSGLIGFDKAVDLSGTIEIGKELSGAMIHKVKELAYIANGNSEVIIPFTYRGILPQAAFLPNVGNLAGQVIQNVGVDLLDQALTKILKPKQESQATQAAGENAPLAQTTNS